ncbi:medium-chain fatty acid-CoA ligase faa2 [Dispira parvispora]|uniref:Long-chain-fatty-acid--CoA ligase n=1 Tax=Dispira parvispora TaxID=1520584 RepID=A0A9W8E2T7_9FUNG|nr:medium-chain fatty acid-CoA ligase faa2 [Dispira parvispora]
MVDTPFMYSVEAKNAPEVPGEGKPRRHFLVGQDGPLVSCPEDVNSLHDSFRRGAQAAGDRPFLGHRKAINGKAGEYVWETYNQVYERSKNFGAGLCHLGMNAKKTLGLYSVNRPEWTIAEQASYMYEFVTVPLYDTLGEDAVEHVIGQAEVHFICATSDKAHALLEMYDAVTSIKHIVVMDDVNDDLITLAESREVRLYSFVDVEKLGAQHPTDFAECTPDSIATICYTSGTTGVPKGAIITHGNILAEIAALQLLVEKGRMCQITKDDCHISYLPLAHVFERIVFQMIISYGARIGFYQGNTLKIMEDLAVLKPTIFISVPRLFNRVYDKVWSTINTKGGLAAMLFRQAVNAKIRNLSKGSTTHWLWDRLVFKKLQQSLGGNVRFMVSGSAPLSKEVMNFIRVAFGVPVFEGYGQTETSAVLSLTDINERSAGNVGSPFPCAEIKLVDLPDMGYTSQDKPYPRGEICARGNSVFTKYYKDPQRTADTVNEEGWIRTGDVGMWDNRGRLVIIDRAKNIFKLAQGEYVAPERIENIYQNHPAVAQAYVTGHSLESCTVGVIVPEEESFMELLKEHQIDTTRSKDELYKDSAVRQLVVKELTTFAKQHDAKGFECVKNVYLEMEPFTVENDLLSPTFKLKRNVAKVRYSSYVDALYQELAK